MVQFWETICYANVNVMIPLCVEQHITKWVEKAKEPNASRWALKSRNRNSNMRITYANSRKLANVTVRANCSDLGFSKDELIWNHVPLERAVSIEFWLHCPPFWVDKTVDITNIIESEPGSSSHAY